MFIVFWLYLAPNQYVQMLELALRIREVAQESSVPVVENPPLARTLHASGDVDEAIPPEHYKAVAQVIGYVMRLTGRARH